MCHVLIIEDEALIAMMIEDCLLESGATTVEFAASEDDAVAAAQQHRPDFITSDVRLLEGTGPQAIAKIKARYGDIPVLYITASPGECADCSSDAIVPKPFNAVEVGRRFRMAVN